MKPEIDETLLTAYALGELDARERARVAAHVESDPELLRHVEATREMAATVTAELGRESVDGLSEIHREVIERRLRETQRASRERAARARMRFRRWVPPRGEHRGIDRNRRGHARVPAAAAVPATPGHQPGQDRPERWRHDRHRAGHRHCAADIAG